MRRGQILKQCIGTNKEDVLGCNVVNLPINEDRQYILNLLAKQQSLNDFFFQQSTNLHEELTSKNEKREKLCGIMKNNMKKIVNNIEDLVMEYEEFVNPF